MLDELEADADTRRTDAVIKLARISFSGDKLSRGGNDGVPSNFALRSSFFASGIVKPSMSPQDESRMCTFMLRPISSNDASDAPFEDSETPALGADIFGRAVKWWPRYRDLLKAVRGALIKAGYDRRGADTYGNLIACYHIAAHDHMIGEHELNWWIDRLPRDERMSSWQALFSYLMEKVPDERRTNAEKNIEAILTKYKEYVGQPGDAGELKDANKALQPYGLFISHPRGAEAAWENCELFIPNGHVGLQALFSGTKWGGKAGDSGAWANVLDQMPEVLFHKPKAPQFKNNVKGVRGRFVRLAATMAWFAERPEPEPEPDPIGDEYDAWEGGER
jgi:hypothetical protein